MNDYPSPLHWSEGMFLGPQHFQQFQRHLHGRIAGLTLSAYPFAWGVRRLEFDLEALSGFKLKLRRLDAVLENGTHLRIPQDCEIDSRSLDAIFAESAGPFDVLLAIPELRERSANVAEVHSEHSSRYSVAIRDVVDENSGGNEKPIPFRKYRAKLLLSGEDLDGYETLPLARIELGGELEPQPTIVDSYVPPMLCIGAIERFHVELDRVLSLLSSKAASLRKRADSKNVQWGGEGGGGDAATLLKLQAVYMALAATGPRIRNSDSHPFDIYCELSRTLGQLAVFSPDRTLHSIPEYLHSDPSRSFNSVIESLKSLLAGTIPTRFTKIPFEFDGEFQKAELQTGWTETGTQLYLAAEGETPVEELSRRVAGLKLCSPTKVSELQRDRLPGLALEFLHRTPADLPDRKNLHFWKLDCRGELWRASREERSLALFGPGSKAATYFLYAVTGDASND